MVLRLDPGPHKSPDRGVCAAEATAFLAGEPHSDHPDCLCPILGEVLRWLNDRMPEEDQQGLVRLVPLLVGTRHQDAERPRAIRIASAVTQALRPADDGRCPLSAAADWIQGRGDPDDALAILEAEDQPLAWLCAEVQFGGPGEIITTALAWLDHETGGSDAALPWPVLLQGLEEAIRLGPHSGPSNRRLRTRQRRLEAIQRGRAP
jgi:hypothetical protein